MLSQLSLKQRLMILILAAISMVWLLAATLIYLHTKHEVNEILDAHLAQTAGLLLTQGLERYDDDDDDDDESDWDELSHAPLLHRYAKRVAFQFWYQDKLTLHSENAPSNEHLSKNLEGFSNSTVNGEDWRVFSAADRSNSHLVQVAELSELRDEVIDDMTAGLVWALAFSLPLMALVIGWGARWGLKPLAQLSNLIEERKPEQLESLDLPAPAEVRPLIERLNSLFSRIQNLMINERRFTADAAHELRTPIAGISAQVQVAKHAQNPLERDKALNKALQGCQRATHLVTQLLTLARLESAQELQKNCSLAELAQEVLADLAPDAQAKGSQVELIASDSGQLIGMPMLLQVLMRNLIDNAIRYTPNGSLIQVTVKRDEHLMFVVADNGLGLNAEDREKIEQRFYRVLGTKTSGSGLGLSIVAQIAALHSATVQYDAPLQGRGLVVRVLFKKGAV